MTITASTPFRAGISVPFATWASVIAQAGGPADLASTAAYEAAGNLSGLCLAQLGEESSYGVAYSANAAGNLNPLNLRPRGGLPGFSTFSSYVECIHEWYARITDPNYAYAGLVSIAALIYTYAPPNENQTNSYVDAVVASLNRWNATVGGSPMPTRGRVPKPPMEEHYVARQNAVVGQNCSITPRQGLIKGTCWHTEVGGYVGTREWFSNPLNGALADFQVGGAWDGPFDGVIMRFIEEAESVSPYANGVVGQHGAPFDDGAAFVDAFGVEPAVNGWLRSIEHSDGGNPDRMDYAMTAPQIESIAFLTAYIHGEEAGQSWDAFAHNCLHYQFGVDHVGCPGAWLKANKDALRARVVAIMRAYQTNTPLSPPLHVTYPPGWSGPTIAQPGGTKPAPHTLPAGIDVHFLERHFAGDASHTVTIDGRPYAYDPSGPVSQAWLSHCLGLVRGKRIKTNPRWWPALVGVRSEGTGRVYRFRDGWEFTYTGG